MKSGSLLKVSVTTSAEADEAVTALLTGVFGEPASSYTDVTTGRTHASVYLRTAAAWSAAKRRDLTTGLRALRNEGVKVGSGHIWAEAVARENWAESWKRHFKPIPTGGALRIKRRWGGGPR